MTGYPSIDKPWLKYCDGKIDYSIPTGNIYESLHRRNLNSPRRIALRYNGLKITYKTLLKNIDDVANRLLEIGIKPGEVVSVCLPNMPEVVYLIFAINKIGAVGNMLDPRSGTEVLEKQLNESKSRVLFSIDLILDKFSEVLDKTGIEVAIALSAIDSFPTLISHLIKVKEPSLRIRVPKEWISWCQFKKKPIRLTQKPEIFMEPDDAFIAYTGGTTGVPKGVIGTNRNLLAVAEAELIMGFDQSENDSVLDIAPPWTYYGLLNSLFAPLYMNLTVILVAKLEADGLGKIVKKEKPNHIITVPSALSSMMSDKCMIGENLSYLHSVIVGADRLDESNEISFNDFLRKHNCNIKIHKGYGMTEAMAATCITKKEVEGIGSVGIPYLCNTVAAFNLDNDEYKEQQYGKRGEIAVCGPSIMRGYFGDDSNADIEMLKMHADGSIWLHTGDVGYVQEDGRVFIVGRIKRMFTRNGYKVFPAMIEKCICSVSGISMSAVIAVKNDEKGNIIKAFLVADKQNDELKLLVKEFVETQLYDYECPDEYCFIDELPLTGMGKIDYQKLENI